jgi:hypothetical protein
MTKISMQNMVDFINTKVDVKVEIDSYKPDRQR